MINMDIVFTMASVVSAMIALMIFVLLRKTSYVK